MDGIYDNENMRIIDEDGNEYRATDFGMNTKKIRFFTKTRG